VAIVFDAPGHPVVAHTAQRGEGAAMSYSISTLLTRNLYDLFGENDSVGRRSD